MTAGDADRCAERHDTHPEGSGRNLREYGMGASSVTARREDSCPETKQMMEAVVERENMTRALYRVMSNKGAPGVDDMTVDDLRGYIMVQWLRIKEELLDLCSIRGVGRVRGRRLWNSGVKTQEAYAALEPEQRRAIVYEKSKSI